VRAFYPETQTADIQINFYRIFLGTPKDTYREYPKLLNCPVAFMFGGDGSLTFPIAAGDSCIVLFNDRDMDAWYAGGQVAAPATLRMHDISDAIAIVGIRSATRPLSNYVTDGVELRHAESRVILKGDAGSPRAAIEQAQVIVACEDRVRIEVTGSTLKSALDAFVDAVISATTSGGQTMSPATISSLNAAKAQIATVLK